uniref:Uncharacterized protein n=1 Tax=Lepeophtheirus salmonis TaxID=72036 RepID=A0A0K2T1T6_LEPSM
MRDGTVHTFDIDPDTIVGMIQIGRRGRPQIVFTEMGKFLLQPLLRGPGLLTWGGVLLEHIVSLWVFVLPPGNTHLIEKVLDILVPIFRPFGNQYEGFLYPSDTTIPSIIGEAGNLFYVTGRTM